MNNNYELPVSEYYQRKREQQTEQNEPQTSGRTVSPTYPKPLSSSYFYDLQEKAVPRSKDWYINEALAKYTVAVRNFYCSVLSTFNSTVHKPINLPNYVNQGSLANNSELQENISVLDSLAQELDSQEKNLLDTLDRNNTSISARSNRYGLVKELLNYAAKAWLIYDNMKVDNFFHAVVDFKTRNADKDMTIDRNVALVSVGHYKAKNFVKTKVEHYFATKGVKTPFKNKHGGVIRLYENFNSKEMFFDLMETFGGYNYQLNEQTLEEQQSRVTDAKALKVIAFYKNYADVKDVYKTVFQVINRIHNGYSVDFLDEEYLIANNIRRDIYVQANIYLNQINELMLISETNSDYNFIYKDCKHLQNKLSQALLEMQPHHQAFEQERIKNIEDFKNNFSSKLF